ncbi:MAG: efflux RND transporter permease subunit [Deltaproteobacteria bacterium]|jgi:multidrug efflux pump subunit AcrB|nr:efflux RND transporter permease subunit [Deltaproteobacteria bacterium]
MSITRFLLSNRYTVWALTIGAAVFGYIAYNTIPMQLFPDTAPPLVNVITIYPGASTEDVVENLTRPLEEEFASVEGVIKIKSTSQDNMSMVSVEFNYEVDVDQAAIDIQNALSHIRSLLPETIKEPQILKFSTDDRPIASVGIAHRDMKKARELAEESISTEFQKIKGVAAVDVFGGNVSSLNIDVDMKTIESLGISINFITQVLLKHNVALPAGQLRTRGNQYSFRIEARLKDPESIKKIPVPLPNGSRVELGDIAEVKLGSLEDDSTFSINGKRYIGIQVYKSKDANTVKIVKEIREKLKTMEKEYEGYSFAVGEESATFTETAIGNLLTNIWQALLFASLIIFLFIGKLKLSLIAVVSMPLSFGLTFVLMQISGTEFNMVTLTAVILAVGMVVDAAVVVLENISRLYQEGMDKKDAIIQGTDSVYIPIIAGALTTIVVLIPILFTKGFTGKTFAPLSKTLLFAFSSSVVVSLILIPVLAYYSLGESKLDKFLQKIIYPFQYFMDLIRKFYQFLLKYALKQRILTLLIAFALLFAGIRMIRNQGMETMPKMDSGSFMISLETPSGTSLDETRRIVEEVETLVQKEKEVVKTQGQAGFEEGMKASSTTGAQGPVQGQISVTLTDRTAREESMWKIQSRLRKKIAKIPNIKVFTVRDVGNTARATTSAPIIILLKGKDSQVLNKLGDLVLANISKVEGVVKPVRNWEFDKKQIIASVDRNRANQSGITPVEIARQMQIGASGIFAGKYYRENKDSLPVRVRYKRNYPLDLDEQLSYPVTLPQNSGTIPLRYLVQLEERKSLPVITREDQVYTLEITAFTANRAASFVTADVEKVLSKIDTPTDYQLELAGENKDMQEARTELGGALLISIILVYLVLLSQLKSFVHPFTIMISIVLSVSGVGFGLFIADKAVSMPVLIGLILLAGIVVNNAIILLEFINRQLDESKELEEALMSSVSVRFRPIMMTSLSTVVGMIPLAGEWALGSERFAPLAVAVIGGMTAATLLTMVIIPVFYSLLDSFTKRQPGR